MTRRRVLAPAVVCLALWGLLALVVFGQPPGRLVDVLGLRGWSLVTPVAIAVLGAGGFLAAVLVAAARRAATTARVGLAAVAAVVVIAHLALAWFLMLGWSLGGGSTTSTSTFTAPDGARYLLLVDTRESGMSAVYEQSGPFTWRLLPSYSERYAPHGSPPCTAMADTTRVVVRCTGGVEVAAR